MITSRGRALLQPEWADSDRKNRKRPCSTLLGTGIDPETPCQVVALTINRAVRSSNYLIHTHMCEIIVGNNLRGYTIQNTMDLFILYSKENQAGEVFYVDPWQILLATADAAAEAEVEREKHILDHTSPTAQDCTRTNYHLWKDITFFINMHRKNVVNSVVNITLQGVR